MGVLPLEKPVSECCIRKEWYIIDRIMYATQKYHVRAKMESSEQLTCPGQTVANRLLRFYRSIGNSNQCFDVYTLHIVHTYIKSPTITITYVNILIYWLYWVYNLHDFAYV